MDSDSNNITYTKDDLLEEVEELLPDINSNILLP
jgi:hypothetical protein